jgi:hypothetical protein
LLGLFVGVSAFVPALCLHQLRTVVIRLRPATPPLDGYAAFDQEFLVFRATGITAFRKNGGSIEHAQQIANHASPQTTRLHDRSSDDITLDEVERIVI